METISILSSLGWYWIIAPLAVAGIGILMVLRGIGHFFGGEAARGGIRALIGGPLAIIGLALSLLGLNTQTFARLSHERPVADISVKAVDPATSRYLVTIKRLDGPDVTLDCALQGDEWEISGRVQKWKSWANMLGLDATYTLEEMSNRYVTAERANGKTITACDLRGPEPTVNQYVPKSWLFWIVDHSYVEDRRFGSASFMPLADGAVYRVVMTQSGLNAEPVNDAAKAANAARQ